MKLAPCNDGNGVGAHENRLISSLFWRHHRVFHSLREGGHVPILWSRESFERQAAFVRSVEPQYFAWIFTALSAISAEVSDTFHPPEPVVSLGDLCAFVRGEGYADDWNQRYDLHFMGFFPTLDGVSTYEGEDTLEERWWAWAATRGHHDGETGSGNQHRAPSNDRPPTLPRKPRSEIGLYSRRSLPPELPAAAGFRTIPGMALVIQDARPLWDRAPTPPSLTAKTLGLVGSLEETWVAQTAVEQSENVRRGLVLPFPQTFWEQHPQEIIVVRACVFQFDNAEAPRAVLAHPAFTRRGEATEDGGHPYQLRPCSLIIHGGLGFQRLGHDGETSYWWHWAAGAFFNEVSVVGYDLAVEKAQAVARSLGHGTAKGDRP